MLTCGEEEMGMQHAHVLDALGKCDGMLFDNKGIGMLPRVEEHRYISRLEIIVALRIHNVTSCRHGV